MGLLQTLEAEAGKRELQFVIIGGLAVNVYGYSRETADTDLLISVTARANWHKLFTELGYSVFAEQGPFTQLTPPKEGAWPVDLMVVNEPTFRQFYGSGKIVELYGARVRVPLLENLLALKLHALKHSHMGRFLRDYLDVENLVRLNKVDLVRNPFANSSSSMVMKICMEKYPDHVPSDGIEMKESAPAMDLDLPIAPGFVSRPPQIELAVMLRRIEETMPWRSTRKGEQERRLAEKIAVEFVL